MRLIVANLYVGNKHIDADIDRLKRLNPKAVFVCEAHRWHDELRRLGLLLIGRSTKARRNTGVVLRDEMRVLDARIVHLSDDTGSSVGKERWAYVVRCLIHGIPTSLIAIHLTAGLARPKNMHANRRGLVKISAIVETEQAAGFTPIVGGDHNDRGKVRPNLTPQEAYERLGLEYIWHRNDGIAYDPKVWGRVDFRSVTPVGSDHDFVVLDLKPKEGRVDKFVPYEDWASVPKPLAGFPIGETKGVTFHWEGPKMGNFSHDRCPRLVESIRRFHRITRGWSDIAYNAMACPHGYVFEGRGVGRSSAANGWQEVNDDWYAVCYLGGMGDGLTEPGWAAMVAARDWLVRNDAGKRVNGHRDHKSTDCPGDLIYARLNNFDWDASREENDMPDPKDIWNYAVPEYDKGTKADERPARVLLAQAHNRAGDARRAANQAKRSADRTEAAVKALAAALGPEVKEAVEAALADAVVEVDVNVSQGAEDA